MNRFSGRVPLSASYSCGADHAAAVSRRFFVSTVRVVAVLVALISAIPFMCQETQAGSLRADSAAPTVTFAPQGTIKNVRQAVARFSPPMVPLGNPRVRLS